MRKLLGRILLFMPGKYWNSIDEMPLYNWIKCNNGELNYARQKNRGNKTLDRINWVRLYDEYLSIFGLDDRYKKYIEAQKKRAILQSQYIISRDKFKLTEIDIQTQRIKDLEMYFGNGQKIETILTWLGKFLGYKVDQRNTTVTEYFTILEEYGKANKTK